VDYAGISSGCQEEFISLGKPSTDQQAVRAVKALLALHDISSEKAMQRILGWENLKLDKLPLYFLFFVQIKFRLRNKRSAISVRVVCKLPFQSQISTSV
jgi:hypothetical protein